MEKIVTLEPNQHRYFDQFLNEYTSVSKVLECVKNKFDPDGKILKATAAKRGISPEELQAEWKGKGKVATDHGTRIHNALERYQQTFAILPEDMDLEPLIKSISSLYSDYGRTYEEFVIHSEHYMVAGTADKVCWKSTKKESIIDIYDYKTNISKGIQYEDTYKKYLKGPVSHLMDCNFNTYALQLSIYAHMLQLTTGRPIGRLNIVFIPPNDFLSWKLIPVPFMKLEAAAVLDYFMSIPKVIEKKEENPLALPISDNSIELPKYF
jgi:hypothetical protein